MPRRHNTKGRSRDGGRFVAVPHFWWSETPDGRPCVPAWATLPVYEKAAWLEVARLYNGSNNGFLDVAVRTLAKSLGISVNKASWCLQELVARGFLEVTEQSAFSRKDRTATSYRLTHRECDRTHQPGSRAFLNWRPEIQTTVARGDRTVASGATVIPIQQRHSRIR